MLRRFTIVLLMIGAFASSDCFAQRIGLGFGMSQRRSRLGDTGFHSGLSPALRLAPLVSPGSNDPDSSSVGASYSTQRIPHEAKTNAGSWLMFYEGREGANDNQSSSIFMRRKTNDNERWGQPTLVYRRSDYAAASAWVSMGCTVTHTPSGRIHLIFSKGDGDFSMSAHVYSVWHTYSDDDGVTWSAPADISSSVVKTNNATPAGQPACYGEADAAWVHNLFTGGICVQDGANAGRLIFVGDHRYNHAQVSWSHSIYSDDNGATWELGGGFDETVAGNDGTNEAEIVEVGTDTFYVNCRSVGGASDIIRRDVTVADITAPWSNAGTMTTGTADVPAVSCHASLVRMDNGDLFWIGPGDPSARRHLVARKSTDDGATWPSYRVLCYGRCAYSNALAHDANTVKVVYERTLNYVGQALEDQYIWLCEFNRSWYDNPTLYPDTYDQDFTAYPCTAHTVTITGSPTGGTFTVTHDGQTTAGIAYNAPTADVLSAVAGLSSVGADNVTVTGAAGGPWVITLKDGGLITASGAGLTGGSSPAAGVASATVGTPWLDNGTHDQRGYGGFNAKRTTDGLKFGGAGGGISLQEVQSGTNSPGGALDVGLGSMTWEWEFKAPEGSGTRVFFDNRNNAGIGYTASLNGFDRPSLSINDGTTTLSNSLTSGDYDGTDTWYRMMIVYERGASMRLYVNGSTTAAITQADTLSASVPIVGSTAFTLGRTATTDGSHLTSGTYIRNLRITHAAKNPADVFAADATRLTVAQTHGFSETLPSDLPTTTGCVLALNRTYGPRLGADIYGGFDYLAQPPVDGRGFKGQRNPFAFTQLWTTPASRSLWYNTDTFFGPHVRHSYSSASGGNGYITLPKSSVTDFIQNTGTFTLLMAGRFHSDPGSDQMLFDNIDNSNTLAGWNIQRITSTNRLKVRISKGGGEWLFDELIEATAAPDDATNDRFFLGVVGRGEGAAVDVYYGEYANGQVAPTLSRLVSSGTIASLTGQPFASNSALYVGCRQSDQLRACDWSTKDIHLFNTSGAHGDAVTTPGSTLFMQAWCNFLSGLMVLCRRRREKAEQQYTLAA